MKKSRALSPPDLPPFLSQQDAAHQDNNDDKKKKYPTLDLHGLRKDAAVRAVTDFLDRQSRHGNAASSWVLIITGTGSHSLSGPVLRTAVESLLQRRHMTFERNTPGSFLVQATSGNVWYTQHQSVDTKVIVADRKENPFSRMHQQGNAKKGLVSRRAAPQQRVTSGNSSDGTASTTGSSSTAVALSLSGPSVTEVAQDEANMERAKSESRAAAAQYAKETKRAHEAELQQALRASMQQQTNEDDADAEFEAALHQSIALSQQQQQLQQQQEEELLQQALRASVTDTTLTQDEMEAQAMALSLQQQEQQQSTASLQTDKEEEEEARMLREILQRSLYETVGP